MESNRPVQVVQEMQGSLVARVAMVRFGNEFFIQVFQQRSRWIAAGAVCLSHRRTQGCINWVLPSVLPAISLALRTCHLH